MIDFVREHVVDVAGVCQRLNVSSDTVYRWFRQGLERAKLGGKVYTSLEALQRFSGQSDEVPPCPAALDREHQAALRNLKERFGITLDDGPVRRRTKK